jgi:hypothetical protein
MNLSKRMVIPGIILIAIGLLVALAPWTFAPVCEVPTAENPNGLWVTTAAGKLLPMPCGYTARAEIGIGATIAILGGFMMFATSATLIAALGAVGVALGGLTVALPNLLTRMCALNSHSCNTVTAPTLDLLGISLVSVSLGLALYRNRFLLPDSSRNQGVSG